MGSRVLPTRIMCVNCNICINKLRRYPAFELDSRVTVQICSWIYPKIILEQDYVCEACRDLAITAVNNNLQGEVSVSAQAGASTRGHKNVCFLCGCSIVKRQSDKIITENPTEMQQSIINIIASKVSPREILSLDRVCHACWLRTKREVVRTNNRDAIRPLLDIKDEGNDLVLPNLPQPSTPVVQNESASTGQKQSIILPDYRRAANSTHKCVFPNCDSTRLHNISDKLRAKILHNHNYYLPKLARICNEHLTNNSWNTLYNSDNSIQTFTIDQIQHVFSFVNALRPTLDLENIQDMDDKIFENWIGLSKEKFNDLIEEVPRISELRRGKLGLAALLLKMRTGDSNSRISSLVQVPRRTLEGLMDSVKASLYTEASSRSCKN